MGLLGKLSGVDQAVSLRKRVLADIAQQIDSGRSEATVVVSRSDLPKVAAFSAFIAGLRVAIKSAGYRVSDVTEHRGSGAVTLRVTS
jgi:hypothetical protein